VVHVTKVQPVHRQPQEEELTTLHNKSPETRSALQNKVHQLLNVFVWEIKIKSQIRKDERSSKYK